MIFSGYLNTFHAFTNRYQNESEQPVLHTDLQTAQQS